MIDDNKSKVATYVGSAVGSTAVLAMGGITAPVVVAAAAAKAIGGAVACGAGKSVVENFKSGEDGDFGSHFHQNFLNAENGGDLIGFDAKAYVGKSGLDVGAKVAGFEYADDDTRVTALKTGVNFEVGTRSFLDAGVECKVGRIESGDGKVGFGLNADTGIQLAEDKARIQVLGFGLSVGEHGVGLKLPFLDINF